MKNDIREFIKKRLREIDLEGQEDNLSRNYEFQLLGAQNALLEVFEYLDTLDKFEDIDPKTFTICSDKGGA